MQNYEKEAYDAFTMVESRGVLYSMDACPHENEQHRVPIVTDLGCGVGMDGPSFVLDPAHYLFDTSSALPIWPSYSSKSFPLRRNCLH